MSLFTYQSLHLSAAFCLSVLLGGDAVDYIMSRLSDQSKSRRQVLRQLVQLGVIGSAKELKRHKRSVVSVSRCVRLFVW